MPEVLDKLIELCKTGDVQALRLYFSVAMPPNKPQTQPATIGLKRGQTFVDAGNLICSEMIAGNLSPTAASEMMAALSERARLTDWAEI